MTTLPALQARASQISEADLQEAVRQMATAFHWLTYHTHDSRRSQSGFPDTVLLRGIRGAVAELKSERGKLTPDQKWWLEAFERAGFEAYVWRPTQWLDGTVERVLR